MSKRTGPPEGAGQRQRDAHPVAGLPDASPQLLPAEQIHPNPDQPRQRIGALEPLATSIRDQGVLQPILVRRLAAKDYQIIVGERRYRAAVLAGLRKVPCVVREAGEGESLELALVENILRDDLSPFEEAAAYEGLIRAWGHTHETLARRVGKSRTSITETLALLGIPEELRELAWASGVRSRRQLLRVARETTPQAMTTCIQRLSKGMEPEPPNRGRAKSGRKRVRPRVFRYAPKGGPFRLQMTFRRSKVEEREIVEALRELLRQLEAGDVSALDPGPGAPVGDGSAYGSRGDVGVPTSGITTSES